MSCHSSKAEAVIQSGLPTDVVAEVDAMSLLEQVPSEEVKVRHSSSALELKDSSQLMETRSMTETLRDIMCELGT